MVSAPLNFGWVARLECIWLLGQLVTRTLCHFLPFTNFLTLNRILFWSATTSCDSICEPYFGEDVCEVIWYPVRTLHLSVISLPLLTI